MALSNHDEAIIRDYLLGKLDDESQQKIEERLMVEDELFEEFEVSKGELVEEYVAGELPQKEHEWFGTHFLASPEGRQGQAFALAMEKLQDRSRASDDGEKRSWWERFRSLLNNQGWAIGLAATATAALILWVVIPRGEVVTGPTLTGTVITRGEGPQPALVKVPSKGSKLRVRLLFPDNSVSATRYRAELDDRLNVKSVNVVEQDAQGVWVEIPADLIPPGEYSLQLIAIKADGSEERVRRYYQFNVEP
ncbi:MAG TPA: hypothetical protein VFM63_01655 [Pyrinomonadaceae bacterium]|nr:hypothetical protein [Pyrinomonadaceae bacterium]